MDRVLISTSKDERSIGATILKWGRAVLASRTGTLGWLLLTIYLLAALFGPFITDYDPTQQDLRARLQPPSLGLSGGSFHLMGTDNLGRDIFTRVLYGSRISLIVGFFVVTIGIVVGTAIGTAAGYFSGWFERVSMRVVDIFLAFPFILLALIVIGVLGPSLRNVVIALSFTGWVQYARVIRSEVLALRNREFVVASKVLGARTLPILLRHVLPNIIPTIIVLASLDLAAVVIQEGSLSFLGLGVQAPTPSWGRMLAEGRSYMATAWWLVTFPGLALLLLVVSVNLVGDWLRDYLDPRQRGR